jgi:pimeloyl-ACP methyl ester carboxylesterase
MPIDRSYLGFFDVLSHYLSNNGIAVLRFDNRNYKYKTIGKDSLTMYDEASDVHAAFIALRKNILFSKAQIGLLGHSEGGCVATIEAANNSEISFCILLSTIGISGNKLDSDQVKLDLNKSRMPKEFKDRTIILTDSLIAIIKAEYNQQKCKYIMSQYLTKEFIKSPFLKGPLPLKIAVDKNLNEWVRPRIVQYIKFVPQKYICSINCPLLIMYGNMDEKINADLNSNNLRNILQKNRNNNFKIVRLDSLDHNFQKASKKDYIITENSKIESISDDALKVIQKWLDKQL